MPYPSNYTRVSNFLEDQAAGLELDTADLDNEFNTIAARFNALLVRHKAITTSDGYLRNLARATAQALAGTERFVATASQTVFDTSILWVGAFTSDNVLVFVNGTMLDPSAVTVADNAGDLRVTLAAQDVGAVVVIAAFESGAGLATVLAATTAGAGASTIGVEDAGALYAATDVEAALAEVMTALNDFKDLVGAVGDLVKRNGSVALTGNLPAGGNKITGLAASTANGDAVRHEQLQAVIAQLNGVTSAFLAKSGGTMAGDISMASAYKITNLPTATADGDAISLGQVNDLISANTAMPVGSVIPFAGPTVPTGWLLCNGAAVSRTTYDALFEVIGVTWGVGDGTTTFNIPDMMGRFPLGAGSGTGLTTRALADSGGEELHVLTVTELPAHNHNAYYRNRGADNDSRQIREVSGVGGAAGSSVTADTGGGVGHNTMPPFKVLKYIIKH